MAAARRLSKFKPCGFLAPVTVVLHESGYWNTWLYGLVAFVVILWSLSSAAPIALEWIFKGLEPVLPIAGLVGLWALNKAIIAVREPEKVYNLNISASEGDHQ
jgi:hypothetical protein